MALFQLVDSDNHAVVTCVNDGAPADADFPQGTPPDGTIVLDSTNDALYVRSGDAWLSVALA